MNRVCCYLKPGDRIKVRNIEGECIYLGNEDYSYQRWTDDVLVDIQLPSGEVAHQVNSKDLLEILGIEDGYNIHLIFNHTCYWRFNGTL